MTASYLLLVFAALHAALLLWTFRPGAGHSLWLWWLRVLLAGMCFDNLVQGMGSWLIDAPAYEAANRLRFFAHAALLPLLTLFTLAVARDAGVGFAGRRGFALFCYGFTALALAWGLYHEVVLLQLEPVSAVGVEKLTTTSKLPPIGTIVTNVLILPLAAAIWRAAGWPWLFLGGLWIFLVNAATGAQPWGFLVGNFAELVFAVSLLATQRRFFASPA